MCASHEGTTVVEDGVSQLKITERRACRLPLAPHPIAAEQARIFLRLVCAGWELGAAIDDLLLVATELVANAIKADGVFELAVSRQAGSVLVEVWDISEAVPDRRCGSVDRVDGRGLLLVEAMSADWGWRPEERGGKTVWSVLQTPDPSPRCRPRTRRCDEEEPFISVPVLSRCGTAESPQAAAPTGKRSGSGPGHRSRKNAMRRTDLDELLAPREVAKIFGVPVPTIARWAREGRLVPVRTPGGHRRYSRKSVRELLAEADTGPDLEREQLAQDAARLYGQGWSIRQVAQRFDCGYGQMRRLLMGQVTLRTRGGIERPGPVNEQGPRTSSAARDR